MKHSASPLGSKSLDCTHENVGLNYLYFHTAQLSPEKKNVPVLNWPVPGCCGALQIAQTTSTFYGSDNSILWSSSTCWGEMRDDNNHKPCSSRLFLISPLQQTEGEGNSKRLHMMQALVVGPRLNWMGHSSCFVDTI